MTTATMTRTWVDEAEAAIAAAAEAIGGAARLGLQRDVPLAARTYIGVGGPARLFLAPADAEALAAAVARLHAAGVRFDVLGAGSNLLIADAGPSFVVVSSERLAGEPAVSGALVRAGAGVALPRLVQRLQKAGLAGLEFAEGIPGSVGGAAHMNAGWHGEEFGARVASVVTVSRVGRVETLAAGPGMFAYRTSPGLAGRLVAAVDLRLEPDDPARVAARMRGFRDHRVATQPAGERNAGCMFRNPAGDHAGRLIDACGLKGFAVGRAVVSPVHANFFVNQGGATFRDVAALMDAVRGRVLRDTGVTLEPEVVLWT
jgi:UDP-N-acetylmuramate dehydrogenase